MKRASVLLVLLLGGCRAVLGVEDLVLDEDGGVDDAASEGGANVDGGGTSEGGTDAAAADVSNDTAPANTCLAKGSECRKCCHDTPPYNAGFPQLFDIAKQKGCLCNASDPNGSCQNACATELCQQAKSEPTCAKCADDLLDQAPPSCNDAFAECRKNASCAASLDCVQQCSP